VFGKAGRNPYEWLPAGSRRAVLWTAAALALFLFAILTWIGAPLRTEEAPLGIVSFEFAGTLLQAQRILSSWGPAGLAAAGLNLGLDFLFLLAYPAAIGLACAAVARRLPPAAGAYAALGLLLARGQLAAGLLDTVENISLAQLLLGFSNPSLPAVAFGCAAVKFILVGLGLVYLVIGIPAARTVRELEKTPNSVPPYVEPLRRPYDRWTDSELLSLQQHIFTSHLLLTLRGEVSPQQPAGDFFRDLGQAVVGDYLGNIDSASELLNCILIETRACGGCVLETTLTPEALAVEAADLTQGEATVAWLSDPVRMYPFWDGENAYHYWEKFVPIAEECGYSLAVTAEPEQNRVHLQVSQANLFEQG
jgi:hypothetical protein